MGLAAVVMSLPPRVRENTGFGLPPRPPEGPKFSTSLARPPAAQTSLSEWHGKSHVTANYIQRPELRFMQIKQRDLLFVYRMVDPELGSTALNITNLKHMNRILRNAGNEVFSKMRSSEQVQNSVEQKQLNRLLSVHESGWDTIPVYKQIQQFLEIRYVGQYLRAEDILNTWSELGILLSDMSIGNDIAPRQVFSAVVKGWCEMDDLWGDDAQPGTELYLILKRVWDEEQGDYGMFQFVPYVLPENTKSIPLHARMYRDFSGATAYGPYKLVATVSDRYDGVTDERARLEETGLIDVNDEEDVPKTWMAISKLSVYYGPPKGRKTAWQF